MDITAEYEMPSVIGTTVQKQNGANGTFHWDKN